MERYIKNRCINEYKYRGMNMVKQKVSMTIDENVYDQFKKYCEKNGMKVSTKVELMIKEVLKDTSLKEFIK